MITYQVVKLNRATGRGEVVEVVTAQSSAIAIVTHLTQKGEKVWVRTLNPTVPEFTAVTPFGGRRLPDGNQVSGRYGYVNSKKGVGVNVK